MTVRLTRREFAIAGGAAMLALPAAAQNTAPLMRSIPRSGELLPAVGGHPGQSHALLIDHLRAGADTVLPAAGAFTEAAT